MPGLLRSDAFCPVCGRDLLMVGRTTTFRWRLEPRVTLEFEHMPGEYKYPHAVRGDMETMDRLHARLVAAPEPTR